MSPKEFNALVDGLARANRLTEDQAIRYAELIGDVWHTEGGFIKAGGTLLKMPVSDDKPKNVATSDEKQGLASLYRRRLRIKANPYHDGFGRFTNAEGATSAAGAATMAALRSMPVVDSANDKAARKWRKEHQKLYEEDPEFRATCDAITLYTQGSFRNIRQAAELVATGKIEPVARLSGETDLNKPLSYATNPLAKYVNYFDGQDVTKESPTTIMEAGKLIHQAIAASPPSDRSLYRGVRAGYVRRIAYRPDGTIDLEGSTVELSYRIPKVGDSFDLAGTSSFTDSEATAKNFSLYQSGKPKAGAVGRTDVPIVVEVKPGARALNVSALSPWKGQREFVTAGRFKVAEVREEEHEVFERGFSRMQKGYRIVVEPGAALSVGKIAWVNRLNPETPFVRYTFDEKWVYDTDDPYRPDA